MTPHTHTRAVVRGFGVSPLVPVGTDSSSLCVRGFSRGSASEFCYLRWEIAKLVVVFHVTPPAPFPERIVLGDHLCFVFLKLVYVFVWANQTVQRGRPRSRLWFPFQTPLSRVANIDSTFLSAPLALPRREGFFFNASHFVVFKTTHRIRAPWRNQESNKKKEAKDKSHLKTSRRGHLGFTSLQHLFVCVSFH